MKVDLPSYLVESDELFYFKDSTKVAWNFRHEFLLNNVNKRGASFTAKHKVGSTSYLINSCRPISFKHWVEYYFENAFEEKAGGRKVNENSFLELGMGLKERMRKIFEDSMEEIVPNIPDYVYVAFVYNLTINRTWDGYIGEKKVEHLIENNLNIKLIDSKEFEDIYLVDKHINIGEFKIGFQIKPISFQHDYLITSAHEEKHKAFTSKYKGKVFFVHYDPKFGVVNSIEILQSIESEILRLTDTI